MGCDGIQVLNAFLACFFYKFFHLARNFRILYAGIPTFLTLSARIASTVCMVEHILFHLCYFSSTIRWMKIQTFDLKSANFIPFKARVEK